MGVMLPDAVFMPSPPRPRRRIGESDEPFQIANDGAKSWTPFLYLWYVSKVEYIERLSDACSNGDVAYQIGSGGGGVTC